jgi:hypothetical protein
VFPSFVLFTHGSMTIADFVKRMAACQDNHGQEHFTLWA